MKMNRWKSTITVYWEVEHAVKHVAVKHVYNDNFGSKKNWLYMRGGP